MKRILNLALLVSFIATILVPITGVHIHKLASVFFLLFCIVHTVVYCRHLNAKRWLLLGMIVLSFVTGLFGMIWDEIPIVLALHRVISIAVVFFWLFTFLCFTKSSTGKAESKFPIS